MPTESVVTEARVMVGSPARKPASTTPTAMPSGRLWVAQRRQHHRGLLQRGSRALRFIGSYVQMGCEVVDGQKQEHAAEKARAHGSHEGTAPPSAASSAGTMRLHTLAAIMTPAAKPKSALVKRSDMPWRANRTSAAPSVFPKRAQQAPRAHLRPRDFHRCILSNPFDSPLGAAAEQA